MTIDKFIDFKRLIPYYDIGKLFFLFWYVLYYYGQNVFEGMENFTHPR